jgi:hypothetical protein
MAPTARKSRADQDAHAWPAARLSCIGAPGYPYASRAASARLLVE